MSFPLDLVHCSVKKLCRNVKLHLSIFFSVFTLVNLIQPSKETLSSLFLDAPPLLLPSPPPPASRPAAPPQPCSLRRRAAPPRRTLPAPSGGSGGRSPSLAGRPTSSLPRCSSGRRHTASGQGRGGQRADLPLPPLRGGARDHSPPHCSPMARGRHPGAGAGPQRAPESGGAGPRRPPKSRAVTVEGAPPAAAMGRRRGRAAVEGRRRYEPSPWRGRRRPPPWAAAAGGPRRSSAHDRALHHWRGAAIHVLQGQ